MNEILRDNVPFARQYIGARYVPKFYEGTHGAEWEQNAQYEPLTIVTYLANSYCSKKFVPAMTNNPTVEPEYWVCISNFNGQVEILQQRINSVAEEIGTLANLNTDEKRDIVRAINELVGKNTEIGNKIGNLNELETANKHDLVVAINEAFNSGGSADTKIGNLNKLSTNAKDNLVLAINEVDGIADSNKNNIGNLNNLATSDKDNLVEAINEAFNSGGSASTDIGDLSDLTTDDKNNIVSAINEVNDKANTDASKIGNLNNLSTQIKSSLVEAINNINTIVDKNYYTPLQFGGVGDDSTDDTQAVKDCISACENDKKTFYIPLENTFLVSEKIIIPNSINTYIDGWISTTANDGVEISYGSGMKHHRLRVKHKTFGTGVGVHFIFPYNSNIEIDVANFETDILFDGGSYNIIKPNWISNSHKNFVGSGDTYYFNENLILGGRFRNPDISGELNTAITLKGVTYSPNNNIFIKPCCEGANIAIELDGCRFNGFLYPRTEEVRTLVSNKNGCHDNYVEMVYVETMSQICDANSNPTVTTYSQSEAYKTLYSTNSLMTKIFTNATETAMKGLIGININDGSIGMPNNCQKYNDRIVGSQDAIIGVMINTKKNKTIKVQAIANEFRLYMKLYDSNNSELTDTSHVKSAYGIERIRNMYANTDSVGANGSISVTFSDTVDHAIIGIGRFNSLKSFKLCGLFDESIDITPNGYCGLSSIPTCEGVAGDFVPDKTGTNLGWLHNGTSWTTVSMPQ